MKFGFGYMRYNQEPANLRRDPGKLLIRNSSFSRTCMSTCCSGLPTATLKCSSRISVIT